MSESAQSLGAIRSLLDQAAKLCPKNNDQFLAYLIAMALAALDEMTSGQERDPGGATVH